MRIITLDENKTVMAIKIVGDNYILQKDDIKTDLGELGQIQQNDGAFINPTPVIPTTEPTLEDKINYIYYKNMGVI